MKTARDLNREQYGAPAGLRIMSSYFYLKKRDALAEEVDKFLAISSNGQVPGGDSRVDWAWNFTTPKITKRGQIPHRAEQKPPMSAA